MNVIRFAAAQLTRWRIHNAKKRVLQDCGGKKQEISRADWAAGLNDPTDFYLRCFCYFHLQLPSELREHRGYFIQNRRGFGEDAFHVMWFLLFREFRPENFLEIGVYRGQTLSLAALLQRQMAYAGTTTGISPFTSAGDSVSKYRRDVDYQQDTLNNFAHFSLPKPSLLKAFSTDADAVKLISSREWDCIYIDGNHDYDIALKDWEVCATHLKPNGLIVMDDSGLTTGYRPPLFATGGHPGPSKVAQEIDRTKFREVLQVGHNRVFQKIG